jgi:cell division control protein 6
MSTNVFDNIPSQRIIRNPQYLDMAYVPKQLPHREAQIKDIAGLIAPILPGKQCVNILGFGQPGTGKTAVISYIGRELQDKIEKDGLQKLPWIYINCYKHKSEYTVATQICRELQNASNVRVSVPSTGWALDRLYTELSKYLQETGGRAILILDEADRLFLNRDAGNNLLYNLSELGGISIIGLTNNSKLESNLEQKVKSRLGTIHTRVFPPYNAPQLQDILSQRADIAFVPNSYEQVVIPMCAAFATQQGGDARRAINLLNVAAKEAEASGKGKILEEHVRHAEERLNEDHMTQAVANLPSQQMLLLCAITAAENRNTRTNEKCTTGQAYEIYRNMCAQMREAPLTQRRICGFLDELKESGLISTRVVSMGRGGRTSQITLGVDYETLHDALEEKFETDPELEKVFEKFFSPYFPPKT